MGEIDFITALLEPDSTVEGCESQEPSCFEKDADSSANALAIWEMSHLSRVENSVTALVAPCRQTGPGTGFWEAWTHLSFLTERKSQLAHSRENSSAIETRKPLEIRSMFTSDTFLTPRSTPL